MASDGGIFTFGDAGSTVQPEPSTSTADRRDGADPDGGGYWLVASDGGIFTFGTRSSIGWTGAIHLNKPIVAWWRLPTVGLLVGGVGRRDLQLRQRAFFGSTGAMHLNQPIVGMAATPDGGGYWFVASDGGSSFGDASSTARREHSSEKPVVGMASSPDGRGYWLVASDGGIFNYGDAPFLGSATGNGTDVVGMAGLV